jgi:hypothetical protein
VVYAFFELTATNELRIGEIAINDDVTQVDTIKRLSRRRFVTLTIVAAFFGSSASTKSSSRDMPLRDNIRMIDGWVLLESDLAASEINVY